MNILIINGSPKKRGLISQMLDIMRVEAENRGDSVELVYTNDLSVKPCIGCMVCRTKNKCVLGEDDSQRMIAKPYWNKGLCTEALCVMIDYCLNVKGFKVLWSDFFVDNPASGRVMEKCGFRDTGEINWCSHLYHAKDRPVKVMRLLQPDAE